MANITPRQNRDGSTSYLIRVFLDESRSGKQKQKSMTWKPAPGMSAKAVQKELNRQATLFEERARQGLAATDGGIRFEDYAKQWMEQSQIASKTRSQYEDMLNRIIPAIGEIKLEKLQAHHLKTFYANLREKGVRERDEHAITTTLDAKLKKKRLKNVRFAEAAGLSDTTVGTARKGQPVSRASAEKIAAALGIPLEKLFKIERGERGLSGKTILHHHRLISTILASAKRERIIPFNVAVEHMKAPKAEHKEPRYLDDEQARAFLLAAMGEEDIRHRAFLILALYTGLRRGELCGLEWPDIDEPHGLVHVLRASQYQEGIGIATVPTKNQSSRRAIKVPPIVFEILNEYRAWWNLEKLKAGDKWQGQQLRLFTQRDGAPINPETLNFWLDRFTKKHGLPRITPHGLRHTFATLQIAAGVDIRTLQSRTGHAQASTLTDIYTHALKSAEAAAAEVLDSILNPAKQAT